MHIYTIAWVKRTKSGKLKIKRLKIDTHIPLNILTIRTEQLINMGYNSSEISGFTSKKYRKKLSKPLLDGLLDLAGLTDPEEMLYDITKLIEKGAINQKSVEQLLSVIFRDY